MNFSLGVGYDSLTAAKATSDRTRSGYRTASRYADGPPPDQQ